MTKIVQIHLICAARPNFVKIAPLYHALQKQNWVDTKIIHTGQHYDINMSDSFFKDLQLPSPHVHLGIGSGSHAEQTGKVMIAYERVITEMKPDMIIVVGDVNSTLACTLAAKKIACDFGHRSSDRHVHPLVAHLEAGLRSFDRSMPEEINRIITDSIADILWTPSIDGDENLVREGIPKNKIQRVGNIMIDSLEMLRGKIESESTYKELNLVKNNFAVVTLHRPSNVDDPIILKRIFKSLMNLSKYLMVIFPVHPRTRANMDRAQLNDILSNTTNLKTIEPISYRKFMNLIFNCRLVITDSGGIQEETTYLGIPCLTLRSNTERPVTVNQGTNQLCTIENLEAKVQKIISNHTKQTEQIEFWDGRTADRVVDSIKEIFKV